MTRLLACVSVIVSVLFLSVPARSADLIVMTGPYPPYSLAKGLHVAGVSVDAIVSILEMTGTPFDRKSIRLMQWKKAEAATLAMPNCIMLNVPRTPDIEGKFQWVGPLDFPEMALIGKAGRDFGIRKAADASKYTVGAVRGQDAASEILAQGLNPGALRTDSLYIQTLKGLQDGKVDLVAFPLENATYLMRTLGMNQEDYQVAYVYKKIPLYIALSKGMDPALIRRLNEALAMYKTPMSDGNSVFDKSMARYLPYGTVK